MSNNPTTPEERGFKSRVAVSIGIALFSLSMVFLLVNWMNRPNKTSTAVELNGGNIARLEAGQALVFTEPSDTIGAEWVMAFDGNIVTLTSDTISTPRVVKVRDVHESVGVQTQAFGAVFVITLREDGAIDVRWPIGWHLKR